MSELKHRTCFKCGLQKELNPDNFHRTKVKGVPNFHRYCRKCRSSTRKDGYKYQTDEWKGKDCVRNSLYQSTTISGRAIVLLKYYRVSDRKKGREFSITKEWLINNIMNRQCFYCDDTYRIGCERLDNNIGHTIENCVPCCSVCNSVRSNIFTVLEMKEIGLKIKELRAKREIRKISGHKKKS